MKSTSSVKLIRVLGNILIVLGILLLLTATGVYGFGEYQRIQFEQERPQFNEVVGLEDGLETVDFVAEAEATAIPEPESDAAVSVKMPEPTPSPTVTPTPVSLKNLATVWIKLPGINVDSKVVPAKIYNNEWLVPKFFVGQLEGTANPGRQGNVVLSGHVESLAEGNIFARLGEMKVGDEATIYTAENVFRYRVTEKKTVLNSDISVVKPSLKPILTLITCTGTFSPVTRDYSHRLVIIASLERILALPVGSSMQKAE